MNAPVRIAIVDDHQIVLDGITALLKDHPHIVIAFTTTEATIVEQMLHQQAADILITDIMMPGYSGLELARNIRKSFPGMKIIALSMNNEWDIIDELINAVDISGYVLKNIGKEGLISAIAKVAEGGIYFSQEILDTIRQERSVQERNEAVHLTRREVEIIGLIEKEYSNSAIAETLFISERTVETHRKNIFRKTGTNSVLGLVKYAYEQRLVLHKR